MKSAIDIETVLKSLQGQIRRRWRKVTTRWEHARAKLHPDPIFILGNQKSGTSAIAALLGRATGLSVTIDLKPEIHRPTFPALYRGERSIDDFLRTNKLGFSRAIIKEPNLTFLVDRLRERYPSSRYLFVVRDPRDNIRSMLNRLKLAGDVPDLTAQQRKSLPPGWTHTIDNQWLGVDHGTYIERLAQRWNLASDVYLRAPDSMLLIRYEDFAKDKQGEIEKLTSKLNLVASVDIKPFLDVQYQPRGARNISWSEFYGADNLQKIEQICSSRMKRLGYETRE